MSLDNNRTLENKASYFLKLASRYTIRQKLIFFSVSVIILIVVLLLAQIISQSIVRTASDKKEAALEVASLAAQRQCMASVFRQSYDSTVVAGFEKMKKAGEKAADRMVDAGAASKDVLEKLASDNKKCDSLFEEVKRAGFSKAKDFADMTLYLKGADEAVSGLLGAIETREADLQMEGSTFSSTEIEFQNVTRDGRIYFLNLKGQLEEFLKTGNEKYIESFNALVQDNQKVLLPSFTSFSNLLDNYEYKKYSAEFIDNCEKLVSSSENIFKTGKIEIDAYNHFAELSIWLVQKSSEISSSSSGAAAIARGAALTVSLLLSAAAVLLFLILSYSIIVSITKPMEPLQKGVSRIGQGDLTVTFDREGSDEISQISKNLETTTEKLRNMMQQVISSTETLAESGTTLNGVSNKFVVNARDMNDRVKSVTESTAQASRGIQEISRSAQEMSEGVQNVALAIEQMTMSINDVARNCQKEAQIASVANDQAKSTKQVMQELGQAAQTIGRVVNLISSIADKTNLLALNATIEAASAGEAGRGFAVVASEVKDLARQTAKATQDIRDQVGAMQKNMEKALTSIGQISEVVEEVNTISQSIVSAVEEQSVTVKEVSNIMTVANKSAQIIAGSVAKSAQGLTLVSENISNIESVSNETAKGLTEVSVSASSLNKISNDLKNLMSQFKV